MERRRHPRTPVNINALLIGERTVPRGCRVINVSQHGMMLYCDADGRLSTFKPGDSVDIHLTVQHAGEQKKLTIPSCVKHVAENSVDVEFHHPDAILMDLIESYRISNQHRLEASLGHNRPVEGKITPISQASRKTVDTAQPDSSGTRDAGAGNRSFYLGLLTVILTVCIITGGYIYTASIDSRIRTLEVISEQQSGELSELKNRVFSASLQEGRYASLNARMTALGDAFELLENKLNLLLPTAAVMEDAGTTGSDQADLASAGQQDLALIASNTAPVSTVAATEAPTETAVQAEPSADDSSMQLPAHADVSLSQESSSPAETTATMAPVPGPETAASPERTETTAIQPEPKASTAEAEVPAQEAAAAPPHSTGPWIINLLSSTDKAYVESMAARARAKDISTVISEADIKGRHYWRLQIPGFASAAAASEHAAPVKKVLGIGDVWILKQK